MKVDLIAGARPNFVKIAPIIHAIEDGNNPNISYRFIHTGQHYDYSMSGSFLKKLNIPLPDINLNVGSGSQAEKTGKIMMSYEALLLKETTDLCLVVGDVNITLACAIAAKKANVLVGHVEAGIRSYDCTIPEEINHMVTDSIVGYFLTTTLHASENLKREGHREDNIFLLETR